MAFSSSRLAIKQVTFEADDQRCNQQNVSSLQDLVNFDCEFPQQESLSFYKLFKKRETCQSGLNEDSENIQNFDEFILKSESSRSNIDESFKNHVSKELSKNLIQPMLKISNNDNNLNEDKVNNFFKMNSTTNESILNDSSKNTDQASIDIEKVLKHAEEILRNAHIEEHTSHSPQPSNSSKARPTKDSTPHSKTHKKQISWLSRTNSQSSLVTNDEHSDKIGYAYSNTSYLNSEISRLREENELLIIKINKLKYEIRSKDQVADDLKQKIAQMHIELESTCLSKTQFLTDIESLRNDLNRLNGEKSGLYQNMKELLYENDQLQEKLKLEYKKSNEQASLIDHLQKENNALSKESIDVKMRCLKEKEDLVRNLEQIETDIIRREQNMFTQKYEKILIESCETIKKNEAIKYNDMLKQEVDNIRKDFESKLNDFIKTSENRTNQINEYSNQEKIEKNFIENLEKFQNENKKLENKINQYEAEIEYLKKNLQVEKEKSDAKSNELILINKQKFKLMAQVKQALKEKEENESLRKEILHLKNNLNTYEDQ
ncbi:golgin subfamily A member 3-like isoform X1, partial [Brachionus plicatilis]